MATTVENRVDNPKSNLFISLRKKQEELKNGNLDKNSKTDETNYFTLRRQRMVNGSDPRLQTCRGKLQNRRSKLNIEINKELMLRSGAENLYEATTNKKLKDMVALELQFFNNNLQLLKEQLGELNGTVEIYQGNSSQITIPMIPLGLKETKEVNFREPFKDLILEHYSEDASQYEELITEFMELREAMRTPERDESGIALLFEYFNQLYFVDRRFFPPDRSLGIYFEWYDSLTGTPSCQRTVAFEKACVLFNVGALHTQLGSRHDRSSASGLDAAVTCFLRAAGIFRFLHETFTNAPSKDLSPEVLDMLIQLMLAQARECLHEKSLVAQDRQRKDSLYHETTSLVDHNNRKDSLIDNHNSHDDESLLADNRKDSSSDEKSLELAQDASLVSRDYERAFALVSHASVKDYVPASWVSLIHIKAEHYRGKAHYYAAQALLPRHPVAPVAATHEDELGLSHRSREILMYLHVPSDSSTTIKVTLPTTRKERTSLGLSHGCESAQAHEETLRLLRMCRDLRRKGGLPDLLAIAHDEILRLLENFQDYDEFLTVLDPPSIAPSNKVKLAISSPDFSKHRVEDIFRRLGPVSIFSARHHWTAPRPAKLIRSPSQGFGFAVKGDAPVVIAGVDRGSLAERAGIHEGDILVSISNRDIKWLPHDEVVDLIRQAGNSLSLGLVTPRDNSSNIYKLTKSKSLKDLSPHSTTSSSSGVSTSSNRSTNSSRSSSHYGSMGSSILSQKDKRLSWNPFKRSLSRIKAESLTECNVVLR